MTAIDARFRSLSAHGFTLVELLVGMLIGLLGTLAVMQIYTSAESGRRSAGNMADSQSNTLIGLFAIERDLQQAGMGLADLRVMGCSILSATAPISGLSGFTMVPAAIIPDGAAAGDNNNVWGIPPGDANSDMLVVTYARAANMTEGTPLTRADVASPYRLTNVLGVAIGDTLMVAQSARQCTLGQVTAVNQATETISLSTGVTSDSYTTSAYAFNLGASPRLVVYAIRNGVLTLCDFTLSDCTNAASTGDPTVWQPIVGNVVALVAQYGWDTSAPPDMVADAFCKTRLTAGGTCPSADTGTPGAGNLSLTQAQRACDWSRIPAIRIALVSRSGQYEKTEVSSATLTLWPDSTTAPTTTGPIYTVADRHYRYKVVYSTIALRNVIWLGAQSTC